MDTDMKTEYMDSYNIACFMAMIYVTLMISMFFLYLRTMYTQYRNAHDQWYDINRDYDKKED